MNRRHHRKRAAAGVALLGLLLLAVTSGRAQATAPDKTGLRTQLSDIVSAGAPGAILYVRNGGRTVTLASGLANRDAKTKVRADATFRIGSLTKTQVAAVALQLVGEGKLALTDHLSRYAPGVVPNGDAITIRELLNHTSGIPEFDEDPRVLAPYLNGNLGYRWPPRKLVGIAVSHKRAFAPGARYSYSNTGYLVLGLIIEKITGRPLGQELRRRIYAPLGLTHTTFQTSAASGAPRMHGYYVFDKPPAADITGLSPYPWAAGAVVSTAADTAGFYRALLTGRLLQPELLLEMKRTVTADGTQRSGLGIFGLPTPCGTAWGHGGTFPGYFVNALTSADGTRQAVLAVNLDETSLPKRVWAMYQRLLVGAFCS
jgi:D-alanyl-D-alanine carboxypeptidase